MPAPDAIPPVSFRPAAPRSRRRHVLFALVALGLSAGLSLAAGEGALRIVYRDGGRTTIGAPGGHEFQYTYRDAATESRAPALGGSKRPGVTRLVLQGDSITFGVGVRDWHDVYPYRLLELLNATGERYELAAYAYAGKNIDGHAQTLAAISEAIDPDLVLYQWYVNDLEFGARRERTRRAWEGWTGHNWLTRRSFLYFFLDDRLNRFLADYPTHILDGYGPDTEGWARFRDRFHRWAVVATAGSRRALVWLYPQVPFRGTSPLAPITGAMMQLAGRSTLVYPAALWARLAGEWQTPDAGRARAWRWTGDGTTPLTSPVVRLLPGRYDVTLRLRLDHPAAGQIAVTTRCNGVELQRGVWDVDYFQPNGRWWTHHVPLEVDDEAPADVQWAIVAPAGAILTFAEMAVPVAYPRLSVVDLTDELNTFDTHASIFDAHPNARAHEAIARRLARWVEQQH